MPLPLHVPVARLGLAGLAVVASAVAACGGDDAPCDGAACDPADGAAIDAGTSPLAPQIDWLEAGEPPVAGPRLSPCPAGWLETTADGEPTVCDPGTVECAGVDEARFPGASGCVRIGPACPPGGGLPVDVPTDRPVVYVLDGAPAGGDGTTSAPFDSLGAVPFGALARDTVVAVGTGRYDAVVTLRAGVSLVGACVAETELTSSRPSTTEGVINVTGAGAELRALRVSDAERIGVSVVGAGRSLTLEAVVVEGARLVGAVARTGGEIDGADVVIRDTRGLATDGSFGRGVNVDSGGRVRLSRAVLDRNREMALFAGEPGTVVELMDSAVIRTQPLTSDLSFGRGLDIESGATATIERVLVAGNRDVGIFGLEAGTSIALEDVVVRDTDSSLLSRTAGRGVNVQRGVALSASRVLVERARELGIFANEGSAVTLADTVVRDITGQERDGVLGRGLEAQLGASLVGTRVLVERAINSGLHASREGTTVRLEDLTLRDLESEPGTGEFGRGVGVQNGAAVEIARAVFERGREGGVYASDPGSTVTLADVVIREWRSDVAAGDFGRGVHVDRTATAQLSRVLLDRNRDVGVLSAGEALVVLEDVVIRETGSRELDRTGGHALFAQLQGQIEGARLRSEHNRDGAVVALTDSRIALTDAWVGDTEERECAVDTCSDAPAGSSVASVIESSVTVERFVLTRAALCGIHVARGGGADLRHGEISETPIGSCIQVEGYDASRLTEDVVYRDNGVNLQTTDLPLPEPLPALSPSD